MHVANYMKDHLVSIRISKNDNTSSKTIRVEIFSTAKFGEWV